VNREYGLDRTGCSQRVAGVTLGREHEGGGGQHVSQDTPFDSVVLLGPGPMGVDEGDRSRVEPGVLQSGRNGTPKAPSVGVRGSRVVGVRGRAVADHQGKDLAAPASSLLLPLQDHCSRSLTQVEALSLEVEGTASLRRGIPHRGEAEECETCQLVRSPGHHDIAIPRLQTCAGEADGVGSGCTGVGDSDGRPPRGEIVGHNRRHVVAEETVDSGRLRGISGPVRAIEELVVEGTADGRAEKDADPSCRHVNGPLPGSMHRLLYRRESEP